jgi:hypothetical protein
MEMYKYANRSLAYFTFRVYGPSTTPSMHVIPHSSGCRNTLRIVGIHRGAGGLSAAVRRPTPVVSSTLTVYRLGRAADGTRADGGRSGCC